MIFITDFGFCSIISFMRVTLYIFRNQFGIKDITISNGNLREIYCNIGIYATKFSNKMSNIMIAIIVASNVVVITSSPIVNTPIALFVTLLLSILYLHTSQQLILYICDGDSNYRDSGK